MPVIKIPSGKKIIIHENTGGAEQSRGNGKTPPGLANVDLIIDEDIQLTLSSTFESLYPGNNNDLVNILGGLSRDILNFGFSGEFKEFGLQIWKGTQPINLSPTIALYRKRNAFEDVYKPAMTLACIPLPSEASEKNGIGLIAPGPSAAQIFGVGASSSGAVYSLQIGNFLYLPQIVIKQAEPVFSPETDETGYPIYAKVRLDIVSLYTATRQILLQESGLSPSDLLG